VGKHDKIKARVASGTANANLSFEDICAMLKHEGFTMKNMGGSHRIFTRADVPDIINLQPAKDGKAKPYQVKQVAAILLNYPTK
jgi:predicted RNA binding protein YcfA (HicA-like mRNA interferase family)